MNRRFLTAALLAVFLLVPLATSAQADLADTFLDKVAAVLKRAVEAEKMDATDARKVYNAIVEKVEAVQDKIDAWKEKVEGCRDDDDDEADDDDDLGDAKDELKRGIRKAKADRKCARTKTRLCKRANRLEDAVDDDRCSVDRAKRKWDGALRKCTKKLDEATLERLKAYAADLKEDVESGDLTKLEAFKKFITAVKNALTAE
ncbi:MAG: hypothetical protein ABFS86_03455 [Planctomycetota bacterium]